MARILLVTHIYPPAVDGGSKVIATIGKYLKLDEHEVLVLSSNCLSTDDFTYSNHQTVKNLGLPIYTVFHKPLKFLSKIFPVFKVLSKGPLFKLLPFLHFLKQSIQFHPEIIIAGPLPTMIVIYGVLIKKLTGAKLVINASFHQSDQEFHQYLLTKALQSADYIWTLTKNETEYFHRKLHIPTRKLLLVGNGVEQNLIVSKYNKPSSRNLLYIGSFSAHKGIETLIDAFSQLPNTYTLTLAGNKTLYWPTIMDKIHSLSSNAQSRIEVKYNFPNEELSKLIDRCHLVISPSTQESFGLVLLEAMARGRNFIAADIPASIELADCSKAGIIFKQNDPVDLYNKIINFTPNNYGLAFAQKHTWGKIYNKLWGKISS